MRNVSAFQPKPPNFLRDSTYCLDLEASSSQYVSISDASQTGLDLSGDFTIEMWIKLESIPTSGNYVYLLGKWASAGNQRGYHFYYYNNAGTLQFVADISSIGSNSEPYNKNYTLVADTYYHFAVSWTASTSTMEFYINSSSIGTSLGSYTAIFNNTAPFFIGTDPADLKYFDGLIDDVRVWNDVRTAQEIRDNWLIELVGNESNLVAYWKFNNVYTDSTSNGNTLTPSGSPVFSTNIPFSISSNSTKAYYPLNGNSTDYSGNANHGTETAITYPQGRFGQGAKFNGSTSFIDCGDVSSIEGISTMTISTWVYPTVSATREILISKDLLANRSFVLEKSPSGAGTDNRIGFFVSDGTVGECATSTNLILNKWTNVVLVYDASGSGNDGKVQIYFNGIRQSLTFSTAFSGATIPATTAKLQIGAREYVGSRVFFTGLQDEVIIESRAWTAKEVEIYYKKSTLNYRKSFFAQILSYILSVTKATVAVTPKNVALGQALKVTKTNVSITAKVVSLIFRGWRNVAKNVATWTSSSKNSSTWTSVDKNDSTWTNTNRS